MTEQTAPENTNPPPLSKGPRRTIYKSRYTGKPPVYKSRYTGPKPPVYKSKKPRCPPKPGGSRKHKRHGISNRSNRRNRSSRRN